MGDRGGGGGGGGSERKNERKEENPHRVAVAARFKTAFKTSISRLGPYHVEYTPSRPIWEVKQRRARLVLAWVTGWEYRVLKPLLLLTKDRDFSLESGGSVGPGFRGSFSSFSEVGWPLAEQH